MDAASYVTVAVAFDRHSLGLAQAAAELCQRLGKKLCLLHVVEPWAEMPHSKPLGDSDPLWNVTQAVEGNARDLAFGRLAELASLLPPGLKIETRVLQGKPEAAIASEAAAIGTCLLAVGASFDNVRFLPRGLSTALSLLVAAPVPTVVMDPAATARLVGEKTRLLFADDLGAPSQMALEFAFGLAAGLGRSTLHHLHINGLTLASLEAGLSTAAAAAHTPVDGATSAAEVFDALMTNLRAKLDARAAPQREYLEAAGGAYAPEILTGNVHEKLAEAAAAGDPHLLVFGRHHAYYTKPFSIGRVPFRSMLALKRPLVVVPNE
jgi:nucleotide-binding universal stress UspA family protein